VIYTVGFSTTADPIDQKGLDLLTKCASDPSKVYVVDSGKKIIAAFEEIARNIGGLRIAE
jgi:hypothetical protein